jgi:hypothetical protein
MSAVLENATLRLLEEINSRFVCTHCSNSGGEGKHREDCEFYSILQAWRQKLGEGGI